MRLFHGIILAALLPLQAAAQDAVIRLEAKRGATAAEAAAQGWRQRFDDVVTIPLAGGWTAIALGPMPADRAAEMLAKLKADGQVPADSFVAAPNGDFAVVATTPVEPAPGTVSVPASGMDLQAMAAPPPGVAAPDRHLRLEAFEDKAEADAALAKWRDVFPGAALWQLPNRWFTVTLGPMTETTATAWLAAFKGAGLAPKDAFVAMTSELGAPVVAGEAPDLPEPPAVPAALPPIDVMQRALRWAGVYDGAIDGKSGPKTEAAIAAVVTEQRLSPDPGTAMQRLDQQRADWRREMGLSELRDAHTGLAVSAPMDRLAFERTERALSIYGPKDGSGAALILFSQPGGQQELLDLAGLVTALGWVPQPQREIDRGHVRLNGRNDTHIGLAEGWVRDGRAEGYVLIWPVSDAENQPRVASEVSDSLTRTGSAETDATATPEPAALVTPPAQP